MFEYAGTKSTSSNVSAFWSKRIVFPIGAKPDYTENLPIRLQLCKTPNKVDVTLENFRKNFMSKILPKHFKSITLIVVSGLLFAAASHAQYVWLDEKGTKQFSDLPPPVSTPKNKILKTPFKSLAPATSPRDSNEEPASSVILANEKLQKPVTTASKNEDFMKRKMEQEEKDKKMASEKQAASEKAKNCERAHSYQQSLEAGARISTTDKNGERNFLTDAQRTQEAADVKRALIDCK